MLALPAGKQDADSAPLVLHRGLGGQPGSLDPQRAEDAAEDRIGAELLQAGTLGTVRGAGPRDTTNGTTEPLGSSASMVVCVQVMPLSLLVMMPHAFVGMIDVIQVGD